MRFFGLPVFCFFIGHCAAMPTDNSKSNELSLLELMRKNALEEQKLYAEVIKNLQDVYNNQKRLAEGALEMEAQTKALVEKSQLSVE